MKLKKWTWGGYRAAGVWRASGVRRIDGAGSKEAVPRGGALERLVGKGKAGTK